MEVREKFLQPSRPAEEEQEQELHGEQFTSEVSHSSSAWW